MSEHEPNLEHKRDLMISLNQRYASAWAEIGQRINARQSVYVQFATVTVVAAVGILGAWAKGSGDLLLKILEFGGSIGLTLYTWVFALWIRHNDALIGLLGVYCRSLEQVDEDINAPCWHSEKQGWTVVARKYRRMSDFAAGGLATLVCLEIGVFILFHALHCQMISALIQMILLGAEIGAASFLFGSTKFRERIARYTRKTVMEDAAEFKKSH